MRRFNSFQVFGKDIADEFDAILHPQLDRPIGSSDLGGGGSTFQQAKSLFFGGGVIPGCLNLAMIFLGLGAIACTLTALVKFFKHDMDSEKAFVRVAVGLFLAALMVAVINYAFFGGAAPSAGAASHK